MKQMDALMEAVSQTSCFIHVAFLWDTPLHRIPIICSNCCEGRLCMISNCTFHYLRILLGFVQFFRRLQLHLILASFSISWCSFSQPFFLLPLKHFYNMPTCADRHSQCLLCGPLDHDGDIVTPTIPFSAAPHGFRRENDRKGIHWG